MERKEKAAGVYLFLALLTLVFLVGVWRVTAQAQRAEQTDYTITTERAAEGETAPVRVLVDINTATAEELDTLTGIGPSLAQSILDHRAAHGDFTSAEELLEVKGIGESKLAGFRDEITIGGVTP